MSTDSPTQLRDLSQLRGHLQGPTPAPAPSTAHGYRSIAPPATTTITSSSSSSTPSPATAPPTTPLVMASMPASGSKYVLLQHNHSGGFTAYDSASAAAAAAVNAPQAGTGAGAGGAAGGNIVLLAAEPLEMGSADALAAATAAAGVGARPTDGDDGELRSLSWLNDRNLIKGIVTSSGTAAAAAQLKRGAAVALKTTPGSAPGSVCIVSDLIEELPASEHPSEQDHPAGAAGTAAAVYSTTTVHKGPSGTTTVVEYKASKANSQTQPQSAQQQQPQQVYQRTTLGHGYLPAQATLSPAKPTALAAQQAVAPQQPPQQQQQQQPQIFVTSNGGSGFKAAVAALSSPTNTTTTSSSSSNSTTTHHPHKKYLREKMHVQMDQSSHVASTVTVVSSPASSNNSSISSSSASNSVSGSGSGSGSGSASSTAAVNGGNSPVPKGSGSSFTSVFEAINYATTVTSTPPASKQEATATVPVSVAVSVTASVAAPSSAFSEAPASSVVISAGSLPPGYSFVDLVAGTPHVISTPAQMASPETPAGGALMPGAYYTTSSGGGSSSTGPATRSVQLSVSPPPPPMTPTGHLGSVPGGGLVGAGSSNLRSPNSYASYDNEDSLKDFDMVVSSRMHTSTPQYGSKAGGGGGGGATNGYSSGGNATPQKQKHPNNVPYDPLVHTNNKPPYSFSSLIFMAIEGSNEKALPVKEIYAWIVQHFPYFKTAPNGWKNSVRHNLSLNKSFVKVEKAPNMGKGSLWRVEPQQRQNLIQALNRSPYFSNSAVDKISPSLKSPGGGNGGSAQTYDSLDGGVQGVASLQGTPLAGSGSGSRAGAGASGAAVALSTPSKSNGLVMANVASQSQSAATPHSPGGGGGGAAGSHARFDPKLFPNLSKAFRNIRDDPATGQPLLQDVVDEDLSGDYHHNNNNNSTSVANNNNGVKYNFVGLNGAGGALGLGLGGGVGGSNGVAAPPAPEGSINYERLARDCGADSMDDVHAAAAMLFLKHGPKAFSEPFQNGSAPVITSSPSEDHTYSAGGNSNADSGASTPLTNGNLLAQTAVQSAQIHQGGGGSDSNCASSDAAYDSSEENHNITPEELADQQRHRDGVDALLSLSRSSIVECGSVATTHYHSNGSSGSSHGSPHKRASSQSLEEEHRDQQHLQYHPFTTSQVVGMYTNGSGSKMALLSSAAANVAQQHQDLYSPAVGGGSLYGVGAGMLPQSLSAAMAASKCGNKVKPLRGPLRTKKRKSACMR